MTEISLAQFRQIANQEFQRSTAVQSTDGKLHFSQTDKAWAFSRSDDDKLKNREIRKAFMNAITRETGFTVENLPQAVKDAMQIGDYDLNDNGVVRSTKPLTAYRIQVVLDELSKVVQNAETVLKNTDYSIEDTNLSINDKESTWEAINQNLGELHEVTSNELKQRFLSGPLAKKKIWTEEETKSLHNDFTKRYTIGTRAARHQAEKINTITGQFQAYIQYMASIKKCEDMGIEKINPQIRMVFPWMPNVKAKDDTTELIPTTVGDFIDNFPELIELNRCLQKADKICTVCAEKKNMPPELNKMGQDIMEKALDLIGKISDKHPHGKDTYLNLALNTLVSDIILRQSKLQSEIASLVEMPKLSVLPNGDEIEVVEHPSGPNNKSEDWKEEHYQPKPEKGLDFNWAERLEENHELDITEMDWLEDEAETLQKKAQKNAESSQAAKELLTNGTFDRLFQKLQEAGQLAKNGVQVDFSEIKSELKTIEAQLKVK